MPQYRLSIHGDPDDLIVKSDLEFDDFVAFVNRGGTVPVRIGGQIAALNTRHVVLVQLDYLA